MVIEEYTQEPAEYQSNAPAIVILSAKNAERLKDQARALSRFLKENDKIDLHDMAYTLQLGRAAMEERLAIIVEDRAMLPWTD